MNFWQITAELFDGFAYTLLIFGVTLAAAIPLGLLVAFGSMSKLKFLSYPIKSFVWAMAVYTGGTNRDSAREMP